MIRSSKIVKIGRALQKVPLSPMRIFESAFLSIDLTNNVKTNPFIIILIALPRSGSTLTYQALTHSIRSVYLSNFSNLLYQLPLLGHSFIRKYCDNNISDFRSNHGFVTGVSGPAEGLKFWDYWFRNNIDERIEKHHIHHKRYSYLRKVITSLSSPSRPYITGYLGHVLLIKELEELFPEAIFVRLHRNRVKVAKSILRVRNINNIGKWFSVFPKECLSYLDSPLHEQISAQVYWINKRLESMNNNRTVHIDYESLCQEPALTINKVITYANNNGFQLENEKELPSRFQNNSSNQVDEDDRIFSSLFTKLEKKHGELKVYDTQ